MAAPPAIAITRRRPDIPERYRRTDRATSLRDYVLRDSSDVVGMGRRQHAQGAEIPARLGLLRGCGRLVARGVQPLPAQSVDGRASEDQPSHPATLHRPAAANADGAERAPDGYPA